MKIPGIQGDWEVMDSQKGYRLLRSREYGSSIPYLIVDGSDNLIMETRASLPVAMGWNRGMRKGKYASFNHRPEKKEKRIRKKMTKTQKRDLRDNASLILSSISTAVGVAALVIALNEKPEQEEYMHSELMGPIRRR